MLSEAVFLFGPNEKMFSTPLCDPSCHFVIYPPFISQYALLCFSFFHQFSILSWHQFKTAVIYVDTYIRVQYNIMKFKLPYVGVNMAGISWCQSFRQSFVVNACREQWDLSNRFLFRCVIYVYSVHVCNLDNFKRQTSQSFFKIWLGHCKNCIHIE